LEGTVNKLNENQALLLINKYTWMARSIYKCSHQDPLRLSGTRALEPLTARDLLVVVWAGPRVHGLADHR
jgi:hypothetical protein